MQPEKGGGAVANMLLNRQDGPIFNPSLATPATTCYCHIVPTWLTVAPW